MKILNAEIALREQTRELRQAQPQLEEEKFQDRVDQLFDTQEELAGNTEDVIEEINNLPDSQQFQKDVNKLMNAGQAMWEAADLLADAQIADPTIAAETDAIEWLLKAKRSKGGGGGGGGGSPSGGSRSGRAGNIAALALVGDSDAEQEQVANRETRQATGKSGKNLPDEFRRGLDRYFELLEKRE